MEYNKINTILQEQIKNQKTPSVVYAIFDKDNIIHQFISGWAEIGEKKETNIHKRYNAFSITKTFTALAILQLQEKGKLNINHPVSEYFIAFPYPKNITIKNLLTHTSGLPNPIPINWIHTAADHLTFNRDAFFDHIFNKYNYKKTSPNEKFAYSNLGYVLLGKVIEKLTGCLYEDYIYKNIIQKLGIEFGDLGFEVDDTSKYAIGYQKKWSLTNVMLSFLLDKSRFMDTPEKGWCPFKLNYVNGPYYGGLIGTAHSFMKYIQEFLNPKSGIISNKMKKTLFTENCTNNGKPTGMCLSWFKGYLWGRPYYAHAGGGGGYYCEMRIYPEKSIGSLIMFNRSGIRDERFLNRLDKHILFS